MVTEVPAREGHPRSEKLGNQIEGLQAETRDIATERFLKRMFFQIEQRFGKLDATDPRYAVLAEIQQNLTPLLKIAAGETVVFDQPSINAFVARGRVDVHTNTGLLRAYARWCQRTDRPVTKDAIAMITGHELTHIDQHTEEVDGDQMGHQADQNQIHLNAEYDADAGGLRLIAKAGYNPREGLAVIQFLHSLAKVDIASTHPRNADRLRELVELVESPDTFLPNMNKLPQVIDRRTLEAILADAPGRPGTALYRHDGPANLEQIIASADTIHDVMEVANAALGYDRIAYVEKMSQAEALHQNRAETIIAHNLTQVLKALDIAHPSSGEVTVGDHRFTIIAGRATDRSTMNPATFYIDKEFLSDQTVAAADGEPMTVATLLTEQHNDRIEALHNDVTKLIERWTDFDSEYSQIVVDRTALAEQVTAGRIKEYSYELRHQSLAEHQATTTHMERNLAQGKTWLQKVVEIKELLPKLFESVTPTTLNTLLQDCTVTGPSSGAWYEQPAASEFVQQQSSADLIAHCQRSSTIYFTDQARSYRQELEHSLAGAFHQESSYLPYLDESYQPGYDFTLPADRQRYLHHLLLGDAGQHFEQTAGVLLETTFNGLLTGGEITTAERMNMPASHFERLRPLLIKRVQEYYAGLVDAPALPIATFIVDHAYDLARQGFDPNRLTQLADGFSIADCQDWLAKFPRPSITVGLSADQQFLTESGIAQLIAPFSALASGWEYQITKAVQQRLQAAGEELPSTRTRLQRLGEILQVSTPETLNMYFNEMIDLLAQTDITNYDDLINVVGPLVNLTGAYERQFFLKEVMQRYGEKIPPADVLHFLEGEDRNLILQYITDVWIKQFKQLAPQEQLGFLEAVLKNIPDWPDSGFSGSIEFGMTPAEQETVHKNAIQEYNQMAATYIRLCQEVSGEASLVVPMRRLMRDGFMALDPETQLFLGDEDLHTAYLQLTPTELATLAEYYCAIEGEQTKAGSHPIEYSQRADALIINSIIQRCLAHFKISAEAIDATGRDLEDVIGLINRYVPRSMDDLYKTESHDRRAKKFGEGFIARDELLQFCFQTYGLTPEQVVEQGYLQHCTALPEETYTSKAGSINLTGDVASYAKRYLASNPSILSGLQDQKKQYLKRDYIEQYLTQDSMYQQATLPPAERLVHIQSLLPERTDYRDELLVHIEATALEAMHAQIQGHVITFEPPATAIDIHPLYQFYVEAIALLVDPTRRELWARRADFLYDEYATAPRTFASEQQRILGLYPEPSYARDEALLRLGNSDVLHTPNEARELTELLFVAQRRTTENPVLQKQNKLEWMNNMFAVVDRQPRKDFLLWTLGIEKNMPLHVQAIGGYYDRAMEDLPAVVFGATAAERQEFFIRLLYGDNGLLDPRSPDDQVLMDELVSTIFDKAFPDDANGLNGKTREVVHTIFTAVLQEYEPYRRAKIFIAIIEVLKHEQSASIGRRLRVLLEELGPVAIKAGQVLSEEKGEDGQPLLPADIQTEMAQLKQNVKTFRRTTALQVLESVGQFEPEPTALASVDEQLSAASIKQVYRSELQDGRKAVTKIRRPSILKHLSEDIRVFQAITERLSRITTMPEGLADRVGRWLTDEADFSEEARNHQAIGEVMQLYNDSDFRAVQIMPVVVAEIYSHSPEHITEAEVRGLSLEEFTRVSGGEATFEQYRVKYQLSEAEMVTYHELLPRLEEIRLQAFDALLFQYFVVGRFTADPHAGNLVVTPQAELGMIDLGSSGEVPNVNLNELRRFFVGFLFGNGDDLQTAVRAFVPDIAAAQLGAINTIATAALSNKEKFKQILVAVSANEAQVDPGFEKFLKSLATASYLIEGLDPAQLAPSVMMYAQVNS